MDPVLKSASIRSELFECIQSYARLLTTHDNHRGVVHAQLQLDRLKLWAGVVGAFAPDKASADFRLRKDHDTKSIIIGTLRRIARKILSHLALLEASLETSSALPRDIESDGYTAQPESQPNDDDVYESGSDVAEESDEELIKEPSALSKPFEEDVKHLIDNLFLLASIIRKPIRYLDNNRISKLTAMTSSDTQQLTDLSDHVRFQLKRKDMISQTSNSDCPSKELTDRLVNAALFRLQRFMYKKRHMKKLRQGTQTAFGPVLPRIAPHNLAQIPVSLAYNEMNPSTSPSTLVRQTTATESIAFSATVASTIPPVPKQEMQKSAPSLISQSALVRHGQLDFPPAPKASLGSDILCPYCLLPLDDLAVTKKNWRQHVLRDLEPYICVFEHCIEGGKLYSNIDDCLQHMRWNHGVVWVCNAPGHENYVFAQPSELESHLKSSHRSASTDNQISFILDKSKTPSEDIFKTCPICLEAMNEAQPSSDQNLSTEHGISMVRRFRNHVAKHLEFLALLSLPTRSDIDDSEESQINQHESLTALSSSQHAEGDLSPTLLRDEDTLTGDDDTKTPYLAKVTRRYARPDLSEAVALPPDLAEDVEAISIPGLYDAVALHPDDDPTLQTFISRAKAEKSQSKSQQSKSSDTYDLIILCFRQEELAAVAAILDEEWYDERLSAYIRIHDKHNMVQLSAGRIHTQNIIVVSIGFHPGAQSNLPYTVVKGLMKTFEGLQFCLSIGIGVGVPAAGKDVELGDVVVGLPFVGASFGHIMVDNTTVKGNREWRLKHTMNPPLPDIREAVQMLRLKYESKDWGLYDISRMVEEIVPGAPTHSLLRKTLDLPQRQPLTHYGTIASTITAKLPPFILEELGQKFGVLCVEDRLYDFERDFPCFVVRGVCNYSHEFKGREGSQYAAITAAAFAKEFILNLAADDFDKGVSSAQSSVPSEPMTFDDGVNPMVQPLPEHRDQRDLEADAQFSIIRYQHMKSLIPMRDKNTGSWLLDHPLYQKWCKSQQMEALLLVARAGAGKSVLARSLVDQDLNNTHTICYFFFRDIINYDTTEAGLFAILYQLFTRQPWLTHYSRPSFETDPGKSSSSKENFWGLLLQIVNDPAAKPVICILDGLDECRNSTAEEPAWLLTQIDRLQRTAKSSQIKFLITSRPTHSHRLHNIPCIDLSSAEQSAQYHHELEQLFFRRYRSWKRSNIAVSETVLNDWRPSKSSTHLWLSRATRQLTHEGTEPLDNSEKFRAVLPNNIYKMYEAILSQLKNPPEAQTVFKVFTILVGARCILNVQQLGLAIKIGARPIAPTSRSDCVADATEIKELLHKHCEDFISTSDDSVCLSHHTVREFLLGLEETARDPGGEVYWERQDEEESIPETEGSPSRRSWQGCVRSPTAVALEMARICVRYLCLMDFDKDEEADFQASLLSLESLFIFAAVNWAEYVRLAEQQLDEVTKDQIQLLYDTSSKRYERWMSLVWSTSDFGGSTIPYMYPVPLASFNGHELLLTRYLQEERLYLESRDNTGRTALMWAAEKGYTNIAGRLLEAGASASLWVPNHDTALAIAAKRGHTDMVSLLLDHRHRFRDEDLYDALRAASKTGNTATVQLLIDHGVDVSGYDYDVQGSALQVACAGGHEPVVRILLAAGADVDIDGISTYENPLVMAASNGHEGIVRELLKGDNIVSARELERYGFALERASSRGFVDIVAALLAHVVEPTFPSRYYPYPLQLASAAGHEAVVELLIDHGADVNLLGEGGESPLQAASSQGHFGVVKLLLSAGALVDYENEKNGPALRVASRLGHKDIVLLLLEAGADANAERSDYSSPLSEAINNGHEEVVTLLRAYGATDDSAD